MSSQLYYCINVPVLNMFREPVHRSEIVSQALFAESVDVITEDGDSGGWMKIRTLADNYEGWVDKSGICSIPEEESSNIIKINRLSAHVYDVKDTIYGPMMTLPFGVRLVAEGGFDEKGNGRWVPVILPDGRRAYVQRGDVSTGEQKVHRSEDVCQLSLSFLGIPYTWGGRSSFGFDCSGFVHMLYREMGIYIPRDSQQQFLWEGLKEASIHDINEAGLVFFGNGPNAIKHVGLHLGNGTFIHTCAVTENAPYVRISSLSDLEWNGSGYYPYVALKNLLH